MTGTNLNELEVKTSRRSSTTPKTISMVLYTGKMAYEAYLKNEYRSKYILPKVFKAKLDELESAENEKNNSSSQRSPLSQQLGLVNKEIDQAGSRLKLLLGHIYGKKEAVAHYSNFGFTYASKTYKIATASDKRIPALKRMIESYKSYNLNSSDLTIEYLESLLQQYIDTTSSSDTKAGKISVNVARKNQLKNELCEYFNMLIHLIQANEPKDQAKATIREWGFLREKY